MREEQAGVSLLLSLIPPVKRKEMADVVRNQHAAELRCSIEHDLIVGTEQLGMIALNRFDIPAALSEVNRDLWIQHLVEEELQDPNARFSRSRSRRARSASSLLRAIRASISRLYSA